jgi:hypothetical protein
VGNLLRAYQEFTGALRLQRKKIKLWGEDVDAWVHGSWAIRRGTGTSKMWHVVYLPKGLSLTGNGFKKISTARDILGALLEQFPDLAKATDPDVITKRRDEVSEFLRDKFGHLRAGAN